MPGSIRLINVNGLSAIVDINTTGTPTEFTAYSDLACTQTVALPATITTDTTFYVKATGAVLLSVVVDGTELAGPAQVILSNQAPVTFSLDTDPHNDKSGTLLGLVSTHSSGGSSAVGSAIYQATSLVLPAAASTLMTFARNAGDDLLDLTDPQSPTAKQAGLYTVTQNALVGVTSAGHVLWGQVDLDLSGEDGWSWGEVALLVDGGADPSLSVSATYYVPAGGVITSTLNQNTGADLTLESWYTVVAFVAASRVT